MNAETIIFIALILIAAGILSWRLLQHLHLRNKPEPEHYAYCKDLECPGCLPSDADLAQMPIQALWGEMLNRCIAQTPRTKDWLGAYAAIVEDGEYYRSMSRKARQALKETQ